MKLFPRIKNEFYEQENVVLKGTHLLVLSLFLTVMPSVIIMFKYGEGSLLLKFASYWSLWGFISLFSKKPIKEWDIKHLLIGFPTRIWIYLGFLFMVRKYTYLTKQEFREKRLKKILKKRTPR